MLGHVLERAAGLPYERLLEERIFTPLGMAGARVGGWPASPAEPDQPRGHYPDPAGPRPQPLDDPYVLPPWMNPAGGIHLGIEDLGAYLRETLLGLEGRGKLLPREAYERIHTIHARVRTDVMYPGSPSKAELTLGHGWAVVPIGGVKLSAADGSGGTFFARLAVLPSHAVAFAGVTSAGDGEPALGDAIGRVAGLPW